MDIPDQDSGEYEVIEEVSIYETIYESVYEETLTESQPPDKTTVETLLGSQDPATRVRGLEMLRDSLDHSTAVRLDYAFQSLSDASSLVVMAAARTLRAIVEDDPLATLQTVYASSTRAFHKAVSVIARRLLFQDQEATEVATVILSLLTQVHIDLALHILVQVSAGMRAKIPGNVSLCVSVLRKLHDYIDRAVDNSALVEFPESVVTDVAENVAVALQSSVPEIIRTVTDYLPELLQLIPANLLTAAIEKTNCTISQENLGFLQSQGPGPISRRASSVSQERPGSARPVPPRPKSQGVAIDSEVDTSFTVISNALSQPAQQPASHTTHQRGSVSSTVNPADFMAGSPVVSVIATPSCAGTELPDSSTNLSLLAPTMLEPDVPLKHVLKDSNSYDPEALDWVNELHIPHSVVTGIRDHNVIARRETVELIGSLFNPFQPHPCQDQGEVPYEQLSSNATVIDDILRKLTDIAMSDQNPALSSAALNSLRVMFLYLPSAYCTTDRVLNVTSAILGKLKSKKTAIIIPCYHLLDVLLARHVTLAQVLELPLISGALPDVPQDVLRKIDDSSTLRNVVTVLGDFRAGLNKPIPPSKSALNTQLYVELCNVLARQLLVCLFVLIGGAYKKASIQVFAPEQVLSLIHAYVATSTTHVIVEPGDKFRSCVQSLGKLSPIRVKDDTPTVLTLSLNIDCYGGVESFELFPLRAFTGLCQSCVGKGSISSLVYLKAIISYFLRDMSSEVRAAGAMLDVILDGAIAFQRCTLRGRGGSQPVTPAKHLETPKRPAQTPGRKSVGIRDSPPERDAAPPPAASTPVTTQAGAKRPVSAKKTPTRTPSKHKSPARPVSATAASTPAAPKIVSTVGRTKYVYYTAYDYPADLFKGCYFDSGVNYKKIRLSLRPPALILYKLGAVCTAEDVAFAESLSTAKHDFSLLFQQVQVPDARDNVFYTLGEGAEASTLIAPLVDQISHLVTRHFVSSTSVTGSDVQKRTDRPFSSCLVSTFRIFGTLMMCCRQEGILTRVLPIAGTILNTVYSKDIQLYSSCISAYIYHVLAFVPYHMADNPGKIITAWKKLLAVAFDIHGLVPVYFSLFSIMTSICKECENESNELTECNGVAIVTLGEYLHETVKFLHEKFDPAHGGTGFSLRLTTELLIHVLEVGAYLEGASDALTGPTGSLVRVSSRLLALLVYYMRNVNGLEQMDPAFLGKVLEKEVIPSLKGMYSTSLAEATCMHSVLAALSSIREADPSLARYVQSILTICSKTDFPRLSVSTRIPKSCLYLDVELDRGKIQNVDFRKPTNLFVVIRDLSVKSAATYDSLGAQGLVSIQKYSLVPERTPERPPKSRRSTISRDVSQICEGPSKPADVSEASSNDVSRMSTILADMSTHDERPKSARSARASQSSRKNSVAEEPPRPKPHSHSSVDAAMRSQASKMSPDHSTVTTDESVANSSHHSRGSFDRQSFEEGEGRPRHRARSSVGVFRKMMSTIRNKTSAVLQMKVTYVPEFLAPYQRETGFEGSPGRLMGLLSEYVSEMTQEKDGMKRSDMTVAMVQLVSQLDDGSFECAKIERRILQFLEERTRLEPNANLIDHILLLMRELLRTGTTATPFEQAWSTGLINLLGMTRRPTTRSYAVQTLNLCICCHSILMAASLTKSYLGTAVIRALEGTSASYSMNRPTDGIIQSVRQETINWLISDMIPTLIAFISDSDVYYVYENSVVLLQVRQKCEEILATATSTSMKATTTEVLRMLHQVEATCHERVPAMSIRARREAILGEELSRTLEKMGENRRRSKPMTDDVIRQAVSREVNKFSQLSQTEMDSSVRGSESFTARPEPEVPRKPGIPRARPAKGDAVGRARAESYSFDDSVDPSFHSATNSSLLEQGAQQRPQTLPRQKLSASISMEAEASFNRGIQSIQLHNLSIPLHGRHEMRFAALCKLISDSADLISLLLPYIFERQASISATDVRVVRHIINDSIVDCDITAPFIDLNGVDPEHVIPIRSLHFSEEDLATGVLALINKGKQIGEQLATIALLYCALGLSNDFVTEGWRPQVPTIVTLCSCLQVYVTFISDLRDIYLVMTPLLVRLSETTEYQAQVVIQKAIGRILDHHQVLTQKFGGLNSATGGGPARHFIQNYIDVFGDPGANLPLKYTTLRGVTEYLEMSRSGIDTLAHIKPALEPWLPKLLGFFKSFCLRTFQRTYKISDASLSKAFIEMIRAEMQMPTATVEFVNQILEAKTLFIRALCGLVGVQGPGELYDAFPSFSEHLSTGDKDAFGYWVEQALTGQSHVLEGKDLTMDIMSPNPGEYVEFDVVSLTSSGADERPSEYQPNSLMTPTLVHSVVNPKDSELSSTAFVNNYFSSPEQDLGTLIRDAESTLASTSTNTTVQTPAISSTPKPVLSEAPLSSARKLVSPISKDQAMENLMSQMGNLVDDIDMDSNLVEELRASRTASKRQSLDSTGRLDSHNTTMHSYLGEQTPGSVDTLSRPMMKFDPTPFLTTAKEFPASDEFAQMVMQVDHLPLNENVVDDVDSYLKRILALVEALHVAVKTGGNEVTEALTYVLRTVADSVAGTLARTFNVDICRKTIELFLYVKRQMATNLQSDCVFVSFVADFTAFLHSYLVSLPYRAIVRSRDLSTFIDAEIDPSMVSRESVSHEDVSFETVNEVIRMLGLLPASRDNPSGPDPTKLTALTLVLEGSRTLLELVIADAPATHTLRLVMALLTATYDRAILLQTAPYFTETKPVLQTRNAVIRNVLNSLIDKLAQIIGHSSQALSRDITKHHEDFLARRPVSCESPFSGTLFSVFLILAGSLTLYPKPGKGASSYGMPATACPPALQFVYPRTIIITCIQRLIDGLDAEVQDALAVSCGLDIINQLGSL